VESVLDSPPKSFNISNNGWTNKNMAELENELGLALEEQEVGS
jgi:hypothetical protein